jgi:hypothetical protein
MVTEVVTSLTLSSDELAAVVRLLRLPEIPGFEDDPLAGRSDAEIADRLAAAERSLRGRGIIATGADGRIEMHPVAIALVGSCGVPDRSFRVVANFPAGVGGTRFFHEERNSDVLVEHSVPAPGRHMFASVADRDALANRIAEVLGLAAQVAPLCPGGSLRQSVLTGAPERVAGQADRAGALTGLFAQAGLPARTAEQLAQTVADPSGNGSVTRADHRTDRVDGFATLEGGNGLWLIEPIDEEADPIVRVEPATVQTVRARIDAVCRLS